MNENAVMGGIALAAIVAILVVYATSKPAATSAGMIPSVMGMSNAPAPDGGSDWSAPFYLNYNYPTSRDVASQIPAIAGFDPSAGPYQNPQERSPQW